MILSYLYEILRDIIRLWKHFVVDNSEVYAIFILHGCDKTQFGLAERIGSTVGGGIPRHSFFCEVVLLSRQLSIIIDESGDFGEYQPHSPYYLVGMLFHDQNSDISIASQNFDKHIKNLGYEPHALHTGPIIRREGSYERLTLDERRKLLYALIHFSHLVDVQYTVLCVAKKECKDIIDLTTKISKQILAFVDRNELFLRSFD